MPQFQLGGSVSTLKSSEPTFSSDFAKELAKESSIFTNNDSVYKSSFATELLESSVNMVKSDDHLENDDSNIYENINVRESLGNQSLPCPFLDDSSDFKRLSQVSIHISVGNDEHNSDRMAYFYRFSTARWLVVLHRGKVCRASLEWRQWCLSLVMRALLVTVQPLVSTRALLVTIHPLVTT